MICLQAASHCLIVLKPLFNRQFICISLILNVLYDSFTIRPSWVRANLGSNTFYLLPNLFTGLFLWFQAVTPPTKYLIVVLMLRIRCMQSIGGNVFFPMNMVTCIYLARCNIDGSLGHFKTDTLCLTDVNEIICMMGLYHSLAVIVNDDHIVMHSIGKDMKTSRAVLKNYIHIPTHNIIFKAA